MRFGFEHSYAGLPERFFARVAPAPVANPQLIVFNASLCEELGLDPKVIEPEAAVAFSGNRLPQDADPIAMAYAGHQFGAFVPRLGDGRAILLGELRGRDRVLRDIQLKGAGLTPFSRNGDGRAVVGPMLREYLVSEAMHSLGVATTRSLAVVTTGETVFRDGALPGAILTRVAASHVRVGTFQYFAARGDEEALRALLDYVIARHYPAARGADVPALAVLGEVAHRQARLIADWLLLGFIHGVMNTDNMAISGETIDYGPCAFMDSYDPNTVFSSIDHGGRYAYANQPVIAQWNLARFAETLLPLIDPEPEKAARLAIQVIEPFLGQFNAHLLAGMRRKIGLASEADGDIELIRRLLAAMQESQADFTLTFRALAHAAESSGRSPLAGEFLPGGPRAEEWRRDWQERLAHDPQTPDERAAAMRRVNPAFIPRNHRVQAALDAADAGDYTLVRTLIAILRCPFDEQADAAAYGQPPQPAERVLQTFCGT
jgi:serine/tyrosine/threonine adenylyltransferase